MVNFGGHAVKDQGHTRLTIILEAWRRGCIILYPRMGGVSFLVYTCITSVSEGRGITRMCGFADVRIFEYSECSNV